MSITMRANVRMGKPGRRAKPGPSLKLPRQVRVFGHWAEVRSELIADSCAVVMDVLRASTTIIHALTHGAEGVIPCRGVVEARKLAVAIKGSRQVLLAGERGGLAPLGFDLGNSPGDFTASRVRGRLIVFTTSNGTRAIHTCRGACAVLVAGFVNAPAVLRRLTRYGKVSLVCAGADGQLADEDLLLAGWFLRALGAPESFSPARHGGNLASEHRALELARISGLPEGREWSMRDVARLADLLRQSRGGKRLAALGLEEDVVTAAQFGRYGAVPCFDPRCNMVCLLRRGASR